MDSRNWKRAEKITRCPGLYVWMRAGEAKFFAAWIDPNEGFTWYIPFELNDQYRDQENRVLFYGVSSSWDSCRRLGEI